MSRTPPARTGPILVAVDFSPDSAAALAWAAHAAQRFECPLVVAHVVHDPASAPSTYAPDGEGLRRMEDVAREMLAEFVARVGAEHPAVGEPQTLSVVGLPATRIVELAEREGAQLVVVGSRGRTGLAHILVGSKAERVAQLSPVPVVIVKAEPDERQ